jgi:hypothetical protein
MATTDEKIFQKVLGMLCELCGAHKAVSPFELYGRMKRGPLHCDCGANAAEVSVYWICDVPCSDPGCLCHQKV